MELALSLGETQKPFSFLHKTHMNIQSKPDLGFCMAPHISEGIDIHTSNGENKEEHKEETNSKLLQLDLLPFSPVQRSHHHQPSPPDPLQFPWLTKNIVIAEPISMCGPGLNRVLFPPEEEGDGAALSSPNSGGGGERGGSSRGSDDEDMNNGLARKKLRLSKDQSAYLEESFKEHNTLNPKQKQALARQLNLRPRQVEVWFQNRRARTKLKQTEVDCEYLKRCCETLTEENRRLQKEVQELRALKSSKPFFMNLPATTLTMCPSCERVATTTTTTATTAAATNATASTNTSTSLITPRLHSFLCGQVDMQEAGPQSM